MQEARGGRGASGHGLILPCFARRSLELSVPLSPTRVSGDGRAPVLPRSKQTRSCTTHCSPVTHGPPASPVRSARLELRTTPPAPVAQPPSPRASPAPSLHALPPFSLPVTLQPEGSILHSGFSH